MMQGPWLALAILASAGARAGAKPRGVRVLAGKTYAIRLKVYKADVPITQKMLDDFRPDLERMGVRNLVLRVVGAITYLDFEITPQRDFEYPVGRQTMKIGDATFEFEYLWAKAIATEPNV